MVGKKEIISLWEKEKSQSLDILVCLLYFSLKSFLLWKGPTALSLGSCKECYKQYLLLHSALIKVEALC